MAAAGGSGGGSRTYESLRAGEGGEGSKPTSLEAATAALQAQRAAMMAAMSRGGPAGPGEACGFTAVKKADGTYACPICGSVAGGAAQIISHYAVDGEICPNKDKSWCYPPGQSGGYRRKSRKGGRKSRKGRKSRRN